MIALEVKKVVCGYEDKVVLKGVSFSIKTGEFVGIVGANGCGKTTLLRAITGLLPIQSGEIHLTAKEMLTFTRREMASIVSFVPQLMEPVQGFTVMDTVLLGRMPYIGRFEFETEEDFHVAKWAIDELQIGDLIDKDVTELSGGEFQRVAIARALAQEPKVMLLDEPISHLDLRYQIKILQLLKKIKQQRTVIATFHDLNMASRFCSKLILMKAGEIIAEGYPDQVLTAENIWKAYRVKAQVKKNPRTKHASLVFLP